MFDFLKKKVEVTVINADDGSVIARSFQLPEDIPQSFDPATIINLQNVEYDVIEAEPPTRAVYAKRGKLVIKVRPATTQILAPEDVLYTLPSICNDLGALVQTSTDGKKLFEMHEDDWRQVELVSKVFTKEIESELDGINEIFRDKKVAVGFQALFVRKLIKTPLKNAGVSVADLKQRFGVRTEYDGIAYYVTSGIIPGIVRDGFAFETASGFIVYGVAHDDSVAIAGLQMPLTADFNTIVTASTDLLAAQDLVLVDWCFPAAVSTQTEVKRYFEARLHSD